jgi:CheY-like chemotaxis protein
LDERLDAPATRGGNETILVVEDNASLRRIVLRQLTEAGYHVLDAPDAQAAMAILLGADPIDMMLTDIVMPGEMDGRELAQSAVAHRPTLKVLLTSGFPEIRSGGSGARAAGNRLLTKPYRKDELRRAVREVLDDAGVAPGQQPR